VHQPLYTDREFRLHISFDRESWRHLARHLAKRFTAGGICEEAMTEVAMAAMAIAKHRLRSQGTDFVSEAVPLAIRALRRYRREQIRTHGTSARPLPLQLAVMTADDELTRQLRRTPTVTEIADYLATAEDDVIAGLEFGWSAASAEATDS
jgi:RNA polymerase sigma-B factor